MESFLAYCGIALVILALGFMFNGFPNIITINKHYHGKDDPDETED
jgi:hypothetical protein